LRKDTIERVEILSVLSVDGLHRDRQRVEPDAIATDAEVLAVDVGCRIRAKPNDEWSDALGSHLIRSRDFADSGPPSVEWG
jgi:hypothetical protein